MTDLITRLASIAPGSAVDAALGNRAVARTNAEASYRLLLQPEDPTAFSLAERQAVASFVAALHREPATREHYRALIAQTDPALADAVDLAATEAEAIGTSGPWGSFPPGPLSVEDVPGTPLRLSDNLNHKLGQRLAAAIEHAHLLVLHPRDASRAALQTLIDAGWTTDGIVTLSQLIAFLTFQIRTVAGLRAIAEAGAVQTIRTAVPA